MNSIIGLIFLVVVVGIFVGEVVGQVYLSKKENKWLGLILPGVHLLLLILVLGSVVMFMSVNVATVTEYSEDGDVISTYTERDAQVQGVDSNVGIQVFLQILAIGLPMSFPLIVLLIIYAAIRHGLKKNGEFEKMKIKDL